MNRPPLLVDDTDGEWRRECSRDSSGEGGTRRHLDACRGSGLRRRAVRTGGSGEQRHDRRESARVSACLGRSVASGKSVRLPSRKKAATSARFFSGTASASEPATKVDFEGESYVVPDGELFYDLHAEGVISGDRAQDDDHRFVNPDDRLVDLLNHERGR